jgi:hypothetical protein
VRAGPLYSLRSPFARLAVQLMASATTWILLSLLMIFFSSRLISKKSPGARRG